MEIRNIIEEITNCLNETSEPVSIDELLDRNFHKNGNEWFYRETLLKNEEYMEIVKAITEIYFDDDFEQTVCEKATYGNIYGCCDLSRPDKDTKEPRIKSNRKRYVQAFISNINVAKSLEEMLNYSIGGNNAMTLMFDATEGKTNWTVPRWCKRDDIVLFMHSKTANSTLTALRTKLQNDEGCFSKEEKKKLEQEIENELAFHKEYGGKIFAIGRVHGTPKKEKDMDSELHYKSNIFCNIDGLFILENPIDISEFNEFILVSRQSPITPVYCDLFDKIKELIIKKNEVPNYFGNSYSTPIPFTRINKENWIKLGLEYRHSFNLETSFRSGYTDYLLKEISKNGIIYAECPCDKKGSPTTFVDNVICLEDKYLPVEIKLNKKLESDLERQCEQYCHLDKLTLNRKTGRIAPMEKVIDNMVLVIDTYEISMYYSDKNVNVPILSLNDIKMFEDLLIVKSKIVNALK